MRTSTSRFPVRRYLYHLCRRTVSRLPDFVLLYLRHSIRIIGLFLVARLFAGRSLREAAQAAGQRNMPYQRGQFWVRRFRKEAECAALASLTAVIPAADFVSRALHMLAAVGWIVAHRLLFGQLRIHVLGWPRFLIPSSGPFTFPPLAASS